MSCWHSGPRSRKKDRHKLIKQVTTGEPPRLDWLNREVPCDLVTVVHKAIDRDPRQRYASAGELATDLQRFADDEPIQARPIRAAERLARWCRRNPLLAGSLTAAAATFVLGTVVAWLLAAWALTEKGRADNKATEADGRLPGDIRIERENFRFYIPLVTCLVLSVVLSLVLSVVRWLRRQRGRRAALPALLLGPAADIVAIAARPLDRMTAGHAARAAAGLRCLNAVNPAVGL
jgi:hypothetical protein